MEDVSQWARSPSSGSHGDMDACLVLIPDTGIFSSDVSFTYLAFCFLLQDYTPKSFRLTAVLLLQSH